MVSVCFYFQVHQPFRLKKYSVFDIGYAKEYFDEEKNKEIFNRVAKKCYLPANKLMLELIRETKGRFKISYSISGTALEQMEKYAPEVLESFKKLADTGAVEFLSETYYHSLASLHSKREFFNQIAMHREKIKKLFGVTPRVFRNTELIYNNDIAKFAEELGYKAILAEGWHTILHWRSPNFVYKPKNASKIKLLLKNYQLSDDIAFRFSERSWKEWPLTAEKFASWINAINGSGTNVNLFMDYETFGEHQWPETGIFEFMKQLPHEILKHKDNNFKTPSELAELDAVGEIDSPNIVSWADTERDLSAWMGNKMQQSALRELYFLEHEIMRTNNEELIDAWRKLQTSDHFYYMCTKYFSDGDVHKYFNPYDSPYECFINLMNIINDLIIRVKRNNLKTNDLCIKTKMGVID